MPNSNSPLNISANAVVALIAPDQADTRRNYDQQRAKQFKEAGLCAKCGKNSPDAGCVRCRECLDRQKERRLQRRQATTESDSPLCNHCRRFEPIPGRKYCVECIASVQRNRNQHKASDTCSCGNAKDVGVEKCRECRDQHNERIRGYTRKLKDEVFAAYGGYRCACCGETEKDFLQLDHIDNTGGEHRKKLTGKSNSGGGTATYRWLRDNGYPPIVQVLCASCNWSKRLHGVCVHELRRREVAASIPPFVEDTDFFVSDDGFFDARHVEDFDLSDFYASDDDRLVTAARTGRRDSIPVSAADSAGYNQAS